MLPSHLLRMIHLCASGDYLDPEVRNRIKSQCIPDLSKHRREVLAGIFSGRHVRPHGFISKMTQDSRLIRNTLEHAHQHITANERSNNVLSFAAAASRRAATKNATA